MRKRRRYGNRRAYRRARRENLVNATFHAHTLINEPGGTNTAHGVAFTLDNFAGVDPYKQLYDLFRIVKVKFQLKTRATVGVLQSGTAGGYIVHALDSDDAATWSDVAQARNAWGSKTCNFIGGFSRYFSPYAINAGKLGTGSATIIDRPMRSPWTSITASATSHYGVKWLSALGGLTTVTYPIDEFVTIYVQFKHRTGLG